MTGEYEKVFQESISDPEKFWAKESKTVVWSKPFSKVLDDSEAPFYRWFVGGELNTCYNAVDYHVENGRADQVAIIHDSPVTDTVRKITFSELKDQTAKFAGALTASGIKKGDRVLIYMPMIPEAIVAMLACARIGAIHSVVFGGFAYHELAIRIDDAKPRIIISASCGIEGSRTIEYKPLLDRAINAAKHKPDKCIIFQRPKAKALLTHGRDYDWNEFIKDAKPVPCTPLNSFDPLYILYTSGTTGIPKGVLRDNGGHAVALKWSMKNIYDIKPGEVFWAASDIGWVVGHSYIVYAPLLYGCTTVIYEGKPVGTPDPGAFWRVISQHKVRSFFTAPTALRAIKKEDPNGEYLKKYDVSCLRYLFLAGERLDPDTYYWAGKMLNIPVIDHWWQTETGWPIASNFMGLEALPLKAGSPTKPVPGFDIKIMDAEGNVLPANNEGTIAIKLPLPPGCLMTLWHNDDKYKQSYLEEFPGYYFTGDGGYFDKEGYIYVMGRVDDVIKVAGHRLSNGSMEEVIAQHPSVAECAVIGVADKFKGQSPLGFVILKAGINDRDEKIVNDLVQMVRDQIGAVASFKQVIIVKRLPKTRSGKILRSTMRKIADGVAYTIPSTIDDPSVLEEIKTAVITTNRQL